MRFVGNSLNKITVTIFFLITSIMVTPSFAEDDQLSGTLLTEGIAYYLDESYEEALESLQSAQAIDPGSSKAAYYMGLTYKEMLRYPEAKRAIEVATKQDLTNYDAHSALGEILYALGRYDEAEASLKRAEGSKKNLAQIAFVRGQISMKRKDYHGAIKEFERSTSVESAYKNRATFTLAAAYLKTGKKSKARAALRQVAQKGDDPVLARQADVMLEELTGPDDEKKPLELTIAYSIEFDDNVLLKPSDEISGVTITGEDDIVHNINFKAGYEFSLDGSVLNASYSYFQSVHNNQSGLDIIGHVTSLELLSPFKKGEMRIPFSFNYYLLDNVEYLQIFSLAPTYGFSVDKDKWWLFNFSITSKDFLKTPLTPDEDRDALNIKGGINYLTFFKERRGKITIGYALDVENTRKSGNWSYVGNKGLIALLYQLREKIDLKMTGQLYIQSFSRTHSVYLKKRTDSFFKFNPKITYRLVNSVISLSYSYSKNISNIDVYDYNRNVLTTNIEYKF